MDNVKNYNEFQIWDDLIDDRFLLDLDEESNTYSWGLNNVAGRKSFPYGLKGNHLFWAVGWDKLKDLPLPISNLYDYLSKVVLKDKYVLNNVQMNGQSMGQDGTTHKDPGYTLMVFINHRWKSEWGGDFQLLNSEYKINKSIKVEPGRVILFNGQIPHRGLAPTHPYILRKSLVFRIEKI